MKHTPGPWEVTYTKATTRIKSNDGHGIVATVPVRYSKTDNLAENAANARLIAAAPELLDWLKTAAVWIDQTREDERTGEGQNAKALLEDIHAVIAKVEGVTP